MTKLVWGLNAPNYFSGVEGGLLHSPETGLIVPWNGLVSVDEKDVDVGELTAAFEGKTYSNLRFGGFYQCNVSAYSFPYEFLSAIGIREIMPGCFITGQQPTRFNFSYKTLVGESGYLIHFVYNAVAVPTNLEYETLNDTVKVTRRKWTITATPPNLTGGRTTAHVIVDSTVTDPAVLAVVEDTLYGTDITTPDFPTQSELVTIFVS